MRLSGPEVGKSHGTGTNIISAAKITSCRTGKTKLWDELPVRRGKSSEVTQTENRVEGSRIYWEVRHNRRQWTMTEEPL